MRWGAPKVVASPTSSPTAAGSSSALSSSAPFGVDTPASSARMIPLNISALTIGDEIGKGRFKQVHRGTLERTKGELLDIVVLRYQNGGNEEREVQVLTALATNPLSFPFAPKIYGACESGRSFLVIEEQAKWGSLKCAITDEQIAPDVTPMHMVHASAQLAGAMSFLQSVRIVHADLSCRNVLLFSLVEDPANIVVKISDFGLAAQLREGSSGVTRKQPQATRWCAPETIAYQRLSHRADVWALGATVWELFSLGVAPWSRWQKRANVAARLRSLAENCHCKDTAISMDVSEDFPLQDGCPEAAHMVMLSCLEADEHLRPSFVELQQAFLRVGSATDDVEEVANGASCGTAAATEATSARGVSLDVPGAGTGRSTPSTSATPSVPWLVDGLGWTKHPGASKRVPSGATTFADALHEFLRSEQAVELLNGKDALAALKDFLHSVEVPGHEGQTKATDSNLDAVWSSEDYISDLQRRRDAATRARSLTAIPSPGAPLRDVLLPLTGKSHALESEVSQGAWTLLSLADQSTLRRREFAAGPDAWAAFVASGATPCMLRDPVGTDIASRHWLVAPTQGPSLMQAPTQFTAPPHMHPAYCF